MKKVLETKFHQIMEVIIENLKEEGAVIEGLEKKIAKVATGYLLVEQCLWYRLTSKSKIQKLLIDFEEITQKTLSILKVHDFEDLVFTYRKNYTNLYEAKKGEPRKYRLSKKDFVEFINLVDEKKLEVFSKEVKKTPKKKSPLKITEKSNFMTNLVSQIDGAKEVQPKVEKKALVETPKKVQPKVETKFLKKPSKEAPKKEAPKKKIKKFVKHDVQEALTENTFLKVKLVDNSNVYGRFQYVAFKEGKKGYEAGNVKVGIKVKKELFEIDFENIKVVYKYVQVA
jgi:hypothetical protein